MATRRGAGEDLAVERVTGVYEPTEEQRRLLDEAIAEAEQQPDASAVLPASLITAVVGLRSPTLLPSDRRTRSRRVGTMAVTGGEDVGAAVGLTDR